MAETAVLNPLRGFDPSVGDSLNPDYSFRKSRTNTRAVKKPTGGVPWTRETQNNGHTFNLQWSNRTLAAKKRIMQFAEQYEDGYFTIYDWEDGGRAYTGRFTGEVTPSPVKNACWLIQATFEEIPTSPMLVYPSDWANDAIWHYACNDFGDLKTASMIAATGAAWTLTPRPTLLRNAGATSPGASLDTSGAAGDWAAYQYRGYGFTLWLLAGPDEGQINISLDGAPVLNPHTDAALFDLYAAHPLAPVSVICEAKVPLDFHVVQVTALATKNTASTGTNVRWWALQVMR